MTAYTLEAAIRAHQEFLLRTAEESLGAPLPERVKDAFRAVPRHLFLDRYRTRAEGEWHHVTPDSLPDQLPAIYRNDGLGIDGDGYEDGVTISQPAMVLQMLTLLDLAPGHRIFEVGAGSGWNAALMAELIRPGGIVETVEIRESLAARTRAAIARCGITNIHLRTGDAAAGPSEPGAQFDRAVFTAGSHDIPHFLHTAVRPGGLLLFIWKVPCGGDALIVFTRTAKAFTSRSVHRCEFVSMRGTTEASGPVQPLESFEPWPVLRDRVATRRPFPAAGADRWRTFGLRSWLSITDGRARFFETESGPAFGLWLEDATSLALIASSELTTYGPPAAGDALDAALADWAQRGMPDVTDMHIHAYPAGSALAPGPGEWLIRRPATDFICRLRR